MEVPTWVWDDVLIAAKPGAIRFTLALYRHGRQVVDGAGNRRCYWKGSKAQLSRLTGISKRSLDQAEQELWEAGFLRVHAPNRPSAPPGYSLPFERPAPVERSADSASFRQQGGANFAPPVDPETAPGYADFAPGTEYENHTHGGGGVDQSSSPKKIGSRVPTTTTRARARQEHPETVAGLEDAGVREPERWIGWYGAERCALALDHLDTVRTTGYQLRNPAGFLHMLVTGDTLEAPANSADLADGPDSRAPEITPARPPTAEERAAWLRSRERLRAELNPRTFDAWLADCELAGRSASGDLCIETGDSTALPWLNDRLAFVVSRTVAAELDEDLQVVFMVPSRATAEAGPS